MKKIIIALVAVLLTLLPTTQVLAQSPMDVNIGVVSGGDINLGVDVNSGGDVDIIIDGVDFKQAAAAAQAAYNKAFEPQNDLWDYGYYWRVSGIGVGIEAKIAELQSVVQLLINSQAKLIQEQGIEDPSLALLLEQSNYLSSSLMSLSTMIKELQEKSLLLEEQDAVTWNQLMNGAEAHLALLQAKTDQIVQREEEQQASIDSLQEQLSITNSNYSDLRSYVDYLQRQYLYYFWMAAGAGIVLLALVLWSLLRKPWSL